MVSSVNSLLVYIFFALSTVPVPQHNSFDSIEIVETVLDIQFKRWINDNNNRNKDRIRRNKRDVMGIEDHWMTTVIADSWPW